MSPFEKPLSMNNAIYYFGAVNEQAPGKSRT
jgi:hypothetical protein